MSHSPEEIKFRAEIQKKWSHSDNQRSLGLQEYLAANGFTAENLNEHNKEGWTPLTLAIFKGEGLAVQELIHHLVDVNKRNINGDTPLELALKELEKNPSFAGTYHLLVDSGAKNNQGPIAREGSAWHKVEQYFQAEKSPVKSTFTPWSTQKDTDPLDVFTTGALKATILKAVDARGTDDLFDAFCTLAQQDKGNDEELNEIHQSLIKKDPNYFSKLLKEKNKRLKFFTETLVKAITDNKILFIKANLDNIFTSKVGEDLIYALMPLAKQHKRQAILQLLLDHLNKNKVVVNLPSESLIIIKPALQDKKHEHDKKASVENTGFDVKQRAELADFAFETNLEIFSQIQNDYQLSGSALQGNVFENTARYMKNMISYMVKNKDHEELVLLSQMIPNLEKATKHFESFEEAQRLIKECITKANVNAQLECRNLSLNTAPQNQYYENFNNKLNELDYNTKLKTRREYAEKIAKLLETQNSILLPAGWLSLNKGLGHAMLVKIEKLDKMSGFRVTVYNTGSGLEYHKKIMDKTKIKYCPVRVFDQMPEQDIMQFVENIVLKPEVNPWLWNGKTQHSDQDQFGVEDIYNAIEKFVRYEVDPLKFFPGFVTAQRAGTCASKVFSPFFKDLFGKDAKLFKYKLKELVNIHFVVQLKKNNAMDPASAEQLEHSLHNFARLLKKLETKKLPISSIVSSFKRIQEYEKIISEFNILQQAEEEKKQKELVVPKLTPSPNGLNVRLSNNIAADVKVASDAAETNKQVHVPYEVTDLKRLDESEIISFIKKMNKYYKNGQSQELKDLTNRFISQCLPLPDLKKIGVEKSQKLIKKIEHLLRIYNESCLQGQAESTPEGIMANLTLLLLSIKFLNVENGKLIDAFYLTNPIFQKIIIQFQDTLLQSPFFNIVDQESLQTLKYLKHEISKIEYMFNNSKTLQEHYTSYKRHDYALLQYPNLMQAVEVYVRNKYNQKIEKLKQAKHDTHYERPPGPREQIETVMSFSKEVASFAKDVLGVTVALDKAEEKDKKIIEEFNRFIQDADLCESFSKIPNQLSQLNNEFLVRKTEQDPHIKAVYEQYENLTLPLSNRYPTCDSPVVQFVLKKTREENPNKIQTLYSYGLSNLDADLTLRLCHLKADKRNQIFSTVDFFMGNQPLFCEKGKNNEDFGKDYQLLFHCNLFEPGILQEELAFNKNLANHIVSFCEIGIKRYRQQQCLLPAGAFLYEQAAFLLPFIPAVEKVLDLINQEIKIFQDLENKFKLNHENRLAYGRLCKVKAFLLLSTLSKNTLNMDKNNLVEFFRLYTKSKQLSIQSPLIDESSKIIDSKIKTLLARLHMPISQILSESLLNTNLVSSIIKDNFPEHLKKIKNPLTVTGTYPICKVPLVTNNENMQIDLELGQVYLKGNKKSGLLPAWLRADPAFKVQFGNINPKAIVSNNQDIFEFEHQGLTYRIICKNHRHLEIQVKMIVDNKEFWCTQRTGYDSAYLSDAFPKTLADDYNTYTDPSGTLFFLPKNGSVKPTLKSNTFFDPEQQRTMGNLFLLEEGKITSFRLRKLGEKNERNTYNELPKEISALEQTLELFESNNYIEIYDNLRPKLENDKKNLENLAKKAEAVVFLNKKKLIDREILISDTLATITDWEGNPNLSEAEKTTLTQQKRKIQVLEEHLPKLKADLEKSISLFETQKKLALEYKAEQEDARLYLLQLQAELKHAQENFKYMESSRKNIEDLKLKIHIINEENTYGYPPVQIKLPRYNLHFISRIHEGKWQLFLKDKPNFRLVLDEPKPTLIKSFQHCLYLEDIETIPRKKTVLIPMQSYISEIPDVVRNKLPSFSLDGALEPPPIYQNSEKYLKIQIENNKLVPDKGEDLVYLAYVNLYQMDPAESYRLLTEGRKYAALLGSPQEARWLSQIVLHHGSKHATQVFNRSGMLSVQLQAVYLLIKNHMETDPRILHSFYQNKEFSDRLTQLLANYLNTLGNTPVKMRLSPEVELTILRFVKNHPKMNLSKLPKTLLARYKNLEGWELLKERQILLSKNAIPNKEKLEEINQQLLQETIKTPYSFEFEHIDPRKINELNGIEKYQTTDFDRMLSDKKTFVANFQFLANIMLIKEPIERHYAKELVLSLSSMKQKLTKVLTNNLDNLNFRNLKARKKLNLTLNDWDKLIVECSKTLLFIAQNPDAYVSFVAQLQNESIADVILAMNAQNRLFKNDFITLELPVDPKQIDKQWPVKEEIPIKLIKPVDQKAENEATLQELYALPKFLSSTSQTEQKAALESNFISTLPPEMQADYNLGKNRNNVENSFGRFCYEILGPHLQKSLKEFSDRISTDLTQQEKALSVLSQEMLAFANKQFETHNMQMSLLGQTAKLLTLSDLISPFLSNDQNKYSELTGLNGKEIEDLHNKIHQWLIKSTTVQQLKRVEPHLKRLNQNNLSNQELAQIGLNLGKALYTKRAYDPYQHPILLIFEHFEEILLRPDQISMLTDLLENTQGIQKDKILQLIMGGGKSKVLMPLSAKLNADGDHLYFVEVPSALFETNLSDLQNISRKLFNQEAIPFKFLRDEPYDSHYLENLFHRFHTCMLQKNYIVTTGNSMRSLALKRYDLLEALCDDPNNEELWLQLKWVEKILDLIKTRSPCFMDEVDLSLNIQQDLNYPLGKEQSLDPITLQATQELYWVLTQLEGADSLQGLLKSYAEKPKEYIQKKLNELPALLIRQKNIYLSKILDNFSDDEVNDVIDYLKNKPNTNVSFMEKLSKTEKGILSLYRHQINNLLASTLSKKSNEHYGLTQLPIKASEDLNAREIPIPYFMSQPKEGSQFANIYTAINYTIQSQYLNGISLNSLKEMVTYFSKKALLEFKTNRTPGMLTLSHTNAAKEFHEITGIKLPLHEIDVFDNTLMNTLFELTRRNPRTISYVLNHKILPKVKTHSQMLNMNAVHHASLYKNIQGVSGTTYNWRTFHQRFEFDEKHNLGTDGQTVDRLLGKESTITVAAGPTIDEILEGYFSKTKTPDKVHALIDVGALFHDYTNEEVVAAIEKNISKYQTKRCEYILYFNSANILCAKSILNKDLPPIEIGTTEIHAIKKILKCNPENWFAYYDQAHTIGTDLKQDFNATAIVTVSKNSSLRDLLQGIMRMREYAQNQSADFIIPQDLNEQFDQKPTVEKIISLSTQNQSEQLLAQYYISVRRKIQNEFRENLEGYLKQVTDEKEKLNVYRAFSPFFKTTAEIDPDTEFGGLDIESNTLEILNRYQTQCLKLWEKAIDEASFPLDEKLKQQLDVTTKKIIKDMEPYLPKTVKVAKLEPVDASIEGQKQAAVISEQKQEKELQSQLQNDLHVSRANKDYSYKEPAFHKPWSKEDYEAWKQLNLKQPLKLETILEKGAELGLSPTLLVSKNYKNTFTNVEKFGGLSKKPVQYVLMRKDKNNNMSAMIVTQIEASELLTFLNTNQNEAVADIWIETVQGNLFSGTKPKNLPEQYHSISEQVKFFSGHLDSLEENLQRNHWFTPKNVKKLLDYFKTSLLPDEPLNDATFPFVEKRVLEKISVAAPKALLTSFHTGLLTQFPESDPKDEKASEEAKTANDTKAREETKSSGENSSINVKPVVGYYESNDILILRNALLAKHNLKVNVDNLVVSISNNENSHNTYLLPPSEGEIGLDGLKEAISIALLAGGDKQILFPYRMVAAEHWVTGQILIKNNTISIQIHDSAKIYQKEPFIQKLKDFFQSPEMVNTFLSQKERVEKCRQNIAPLKAIFFDNEKRPKITLTDNGRSQIPPIQTNYLGNPVNAYCGGYTTRLMHSLTLHPEPANFGSEALWNCATNEDVKLRAEDAELVKQYNPTKAASFGSRVEANQYVSSITHHMKAIGQFENTKKVLSEIERLIKLLPPQTLDIIQKDILSLQFDKNNLEVNKVIKDNLVIIYQKHKAALSENNPLLHFFKNHNNTINKDTEINSDVILKDLWEGLVGILIKNTPKNAPPQHQ